jgi:hypothetical protein
MVHEGIAFMSDRFDELVRQLDQMASKAEPPGNAALILDLIVAEAPDDAEFSSLVERFGNSALPAFAAALAASTLNAEGLMRSPATLKQILRLTTMLTTADASSLSLCLEALKRQIERKEVFPLAPGQVHLLGRFFVRCCEFTGDR